LAHEGNTDLIQLTDCLGVPQYCNLI